MTRIRTLLIALLLMPLTAWADRPPTGLLTKASPLPATIPFQLRAPPGHDYAVTFTDTDGRAVISGYLRDGAPLRLLVPPGDFGVTIAQGKPDDWQGTGFDPGDTITLPGTLHFAIDGNRRQGHALRLEGGESLRIADQSDRVICQVPDWKTRRVRETTPAGTELRYLEQDFGSRSLFCD